MTSNTILHTNVVSNAWIEVSYIKPRWAILVCSANARYWEDKIWPYTFSKHRKRSINFNVMHILPPNGIHSTQLARLIFIAETFHTFVRRGLKFFCHFKIVLDIFPYFMFLPFCLSRLRELKIARKVQYFPLGNISFICIYCKFINVHQTRSWIVCRNVFILRVVLK